VDAENLERHLAVHVFGSFNTMRAAWPHMVGQDYGRIVMTTSTGMLGLPDNTSYAAAKAAVVGMMRSATLAGIRHHITVNCIAPAAFTRMAGHDDDGDGNPMATTMAPELVAPMAAFLAHEDCPVSGEIYTAGAGRFARIFVASTRGYLHPDGQATVEDVAEHWGAINDETGYFVPRNLTAWSREFLDHLDGPS
jgi:NAD(P)-dependent dehydrogenase (short-subunit alcohol dehydrogenase family)